MVTICDKLQVRHLLQKSLLTVPSPYDPDARTLSRWKSWTIRANGILQFFEVYRIEAVSRRSSRYNSKNLVGLMNRFLDQLLNPEIKSQTKVPNFPYGEWEKVITLQKQIIESYLKTLTMWSIFGGPIRSMAIGLASLFGSMFFKWIR